MIIAAPPGLKNITAQYVVWIRYLSGYVILTGVVKLQNGTTVSYTYSIHYQDQRNRVLNILPQSHSKNLTFFANEPCLTPFRLP